MYFQMGDYEKILSNENSTLAPSAVAYNAQFK